MQGALQLCTRHHICRDRRSRNFFFFFSSANNANYEQNLPKLTHIAKFFRKLCNKWSNLHILRKSLCAPFTQGVFVLVKLTHIAEVFVTFLRKVCKYWSNLHILHIVFVHFSAFTLFCRQFGFVAICASFFGVNCCHYSEWFLND